MSATSNNVITLRRHDLDNVRTYLSSLVIYHHTALAYGGPGGWASKSRVIPGNHGRPHFQPSSQALTGFVAFNQMYFMGLFMGISGYFSAQSMDRRDRRGSKTPRWDFVKDRLWRIGLPSVVYTWVFHPVFMACSLNEWTAQSFAAFVKDYYSRTRGVTGPCWFTGTLLVFDILAATLTPRPSAEGDRATTSSSSDKMPWYLQVETLTRWGWMGVAIATFLMRLRWPIGTAARWIATVQPGYVSQYIFGYVLGHLAYHHDQAVARAAKIDSNWNPGDSKETRPKQRSAAGLSLYPTLAIALVTFGLCFLPEMIVSRGVSFQQTLNNSLGGWNVSALVYAIWNELLFVCVSKALLAHFAEYYNEPPKWTTVKARYSYAAFLNHSLVNTLTEIGLDSLLLATPFFRNVVMPSTTWKLVGSTVMTMVVGTLNVVVSFGVGKFMVERIPGLKNIL